MQAPSRHRPPQWAINQWSGWKRLGLRLTVLAVLPGLVGAQQPGPSSPRRLRQGQAAWQFLDAVLRADYPAAYGRLAPEVRRSVPLRQFESAARPLWRSGQQRHPEIRLHKLGMRLGDAGPARLFYAFAFAADSSLKTPSILLEVTFRDTASRAVLGFGLRPANVAANPVKPAGTSRKR